MGPAEELPLTEKCHHYQGKHEVPWDNQKLEYNTCYIYPVLTNITRYFAQRYSIFSLYDYGVYMTDDAWFGVTPEPVAKSVLKSLLYRTQTNSSQPSCSRYVWH